MNAERELEELRALARCVKCPKCHARRWRDCKGQLVHAARLQAARAERQRQREVQP